jgi:hypothetical protein
MQCTRSEHSKTGSSCKYPRFLSARQSPVAMERLQELFLLYCMTGTKWGTTPFPELEVFTKYLACTAASHPTPNPTAAAQQPTPPSMFISHKVTGKRRAQSPTPEMPVRKKSKYDYMQIKPLINANSVTTHSTESASTSRCSSMKQSIINSEVIDISDSD